MSKFGPERERTSFDFYGTYGDEREIVYSDKGLERLFYEESPTFLVRPRDVADQIDDFPQDQTTAAILENANKGSAYSDDPDGTIPRTERAFLTEARKAFEILDTYPITRCTTQELAAKIASRRADIRSRSADPDADQAEIQEDTDQTLRFQKMLENRRRNLSRLTGLLHAIGYQQAWHLEGAVGEILLYTSQAGDTTADEASDNDANKDTQ